MEIKKRNGIRQNFDSDKIKRALRLANESVDEEFRLNSEELDAIANNVVWHCKRAKYLLSVEDVQDFVEDALMRANHFKIARNYITYRYDQQLKRSKYSMLMSSISEKLRATAVQNQNANVDEASFGGRIGEASDLVMKQFALDFIVSDKTRENHLNNEIYLHDLNHYAIGDHNCLSCPIDYLLANGFNTRQTDVRPAQSVNTAFQLLAVIFQLQSLQQFGGVSATHLDFTMVPYVRKSFCKHYLDGLDVFHIDIDTSNIHDTLSIGSDVYKRYSSVYEYAMNHTNKELYQAVEGMYHNLNIWVA